MKKLLHAFYILTGIAFMLTFTSCSKEDNEPFDPVAGLHKVAGGTAGNGFTVDVYAKTPSLFTGYNTLYFLVSSTNGSRIHHANIALMPMMDMGMMQHSAPFENPAQNAVNELFEGNVVFTMPSTGGTWTLEISITDPTTSETGVYTTALQIIPPPEPRLISFISNHNSEKFFVALIEPAAPLIGINDFELAIFKGESMMSYPPDSTLTVMHTPEMPTMGHGSPNNVTPVHIGNGRYKGKVNFTMSGYWRINMEFFHGTDVADTTQSFNITF